MVNPTDELCAKLGELGIKYTADDSNDYEVIEWRGSYDLWWQFVYDPCDGEPYGELRLLETGSTHLTPKQAIDATVGVELNTIEAIRKLLDKLSAELCYAGCGIECKTREERRRLIDTTKDKYAQAIAMTNGSKRPMKVSDLLEVMDGEYVFVYSGSRELYHGCCEGIKQHVRVKTVAALYVGRNKELVIEVSA